MSTASLARYPTRQSPARNRLRDRALDAVVFRAIADPTRREILGLLRGGRYSVGELAANFRTSRPAISKHLRVLRSAGLIVTKQQGTARICALNGAPLRLVNDWLSDYQVFWSGTLRGLKDYVEEDSWQARRSSRKSRSTRLLNASSKR